MKDNSHLLFIVYSPITSDHSLLLNLIYCLQQIKDAVTSFGMYGQWR